MANSTLKEVVCENLANTLSADNNVRLLAEQQLSMLVTNEEFGLTLMEVALSDNLDFSLRQSASTLLYQYIEKHWAEDMLYSKFEPPEVSATVKPLIRGYLLKALAMAPKPSANPRELDTATRILLNKFSQSVSKIAQVDWPSNWPELFPVLQGYLSSGTPSAVYSTLKVFRELSQEIVDTQIPHVAPILLPHMLDIITTAGHFTLRERSNAVKIFSVISETIILMGEYQRDAIKVYLAPHIPRFAEAVINILMIPDNSPDVDIGLKKEIIEGLAHFVKYCRKYFKVYLPKIMELIWHALTTSANVYVLKEVNSDTFEEFGNEIAEVYGDFGDDGDGENIGFVSYVLAIIDFVLKIFESAKYREMIHSFLPDLFYYIIIYTQITDAQVDSWTNDLDSFLEDDDLDAIGFSVRTAAQDLILNLAQEMANRAEGNVVKKDDPVFKVSFLTAIKRHFANASEIEKTDPSKPWWKIVESCLYCLGIIAPTIICTINSGTDLANEYKAILDTVLSNTTHLNQQFLAGRSIWTASRFSPIMNDQSFDTFLKLTASLLLAEQPILRIFALRSTYYFCDHMSLHKKVHTIKPYLPQFLQGLVSIGVHSNSGESMHLVLQTISLLLKLDNEFTISVAGSICSLATTAILQCPDDPTLFEEALDLLEVFFKLEQCHTVVQGILLPTIISVLRAPVSSAGAQVMFKDANGEQGIKTIVNIQALQPMILDVLAIMVRSAPVPLSEMLVQQSYPALLTCLQGSSKEDTAILQNGSEAIRYFVAKGTDQLINYVEPQSNENGIVLALKICDSLLSPQIPESCSTFIGRLIITLILKANHVIGHDNIQHLLRSTLVKLNSSKELPIIQSLILVFAHLLYSDLGTILIFLNSLPAPDGTKSALEFVLDRWLSVQLYFNGYENKASTVALCQLFQHSLTSGPGTPTGQVSGELGLINLHRIEVECEDMGSSDNSSLRDMLNTGAVRTRSKAAQEAITKRKVPATVKILKLLLNEYNHLQELKEAAGAKFSESDDETDDGDTEDDDSGLQDKPASSLLGGNLAKQDVIDLSDLMLGEEEYETDEDEILSEEINSLDLEDVLRQVLGAFKTVPFASQFLVHLTTSERELLNSL